MLTLLVLQVLYHLAQVHSLTFSDCYIPESSQVYPRVTQARVLVLLYYAQEGLSES